MLKNKVIASALAMALTTGGIQAPTNKAEGDVKLDANCFSPIVTEQMQTMIDDYNAKLEAERLEQERLAYEAWLRENPQFPKYNLSEDELVQIARLCQQEQGSLEGSAAEASLMANRFELHSGNDEAPLVERTEEQERELAEKLYYYIRTCGWFEGAAHYMDYGSASKELLEVIRLVLVEGQRTLPRYVDEHACIVNCHIDTDQYIPHVTNIRDDFGGKFKFYCFPTETSDPFGYTNVANREKYGDDCYEFERLLTR